MKLKNYWNRFWTLDRHHAAGFTLVELIVVIAILAILAGVGIPVYSGYITKANQQVDITLAGDIKNALLAAYYAGDLEPGASVVVYYGEGKPISVDPDGDGKDLGAGAAMIAAFGEGYANMTLKSDTWKDQMGVAADAAMMGHVNNSNFNSETMGETLAQVQKVVDAASGLLGGTGGASINLSPEVKAYLGKAGIDYSTINEGNAEAIANAMVFAVAESVSTAETFDNNQFLEVWAVYTMTPAAGEALFTATENGLGLDPISAAAAKYAATLSLAQHLDKITNEQFDYTGQLGGEGTGILDQQEAVHNAMVAYMDENNLWEGYTELQHDSMAFLAYMDGVTTSSGSMISNEGLNKSNYFNDGAVLNYVNDYMTLSNTLLAANAGDGALVFVFNGTSVSCLPLDY